MKPRSLRRRLTRIERALPAPPADMVLETERRIVVPDPDGAEGAPFKPYWRSATAPRLVVPDYDNRYPTGWFE
jgi:hypothetical protein